MAMLAITSAVPLAAAQGQQNVCQQKPLAAVSISSVLTLQSSGNAQLRILSSTTITVPSTWPGAATLLADDGSQWTALGCFLPVSQKVYRTAPPTITETGAAVVVRDLITTTANPEDVYYQQSDQWRAGLWTVFRNPGNQLDAAFQGPYVPAPIKWTIELRTEGLSITQPQPVPTTESGDNDLTWRLTSGPMVGAYETANVTVSPGLGWEWADWTWPAGLATDILNILSYGLAFYLIVYYLSGRFARRRGAGRRVREAAKTARRIALAGSLLYVLDGANDYLNRAVDHNAIPQHIAATVQAFVAVAAGAGCYLSARQKRPNRPALRWVAVGLALLTPALLVPAAIDFPADLLPLILGMFGFYAGVALWACRIWLSIHVKPDDTPNAEHLKPVHLRWSYMSALILTALNVAQLVAGSSRDWSHWWLTHPATSRFDWVAVSSAYNGESQWIDNYLQVALWLLVAIAFIAVLRQASLDNPDNVFFQGDGKLELWSMAILLGFVFEGVWGYLAAIPLPVGLLLLVPGFRYVATTTKGTPEIARELTVSDGNGEAADGRLLTLHKGAFYDAAERIADLNSQLTAISNEDLTVEEINLKRTQLRAEIDELKTRVPISAARRGGWIGRVFGWRRPRQLVLAKAADPARVLLDTGPERTWWDNGWRAVICALPLIFVGIVWDTYRDARNGSIQPLAFPFGLTNAFFAIAGIALAWATVALIFGACLPYIKGIRGPVKGVVVGVVHAAALGLGDWLFYSLGETPASSFAVNSLVFLFFLATLGVLIDVKTLIQYAGSSGLFGKLYRLGDARAVVTYIAAIIVTALGIWQQANTLNQVNEQRAQIGQSIVTNINSSYGSGSTQP